jgi:hypothetical protein
VGNREPPALPRNETVPLLSAGNSQYSQQQAGYQQGTAQQQTYSQQQYPNQQSYPGQQQGYGKRDACLLTEDPLVSAVGRVHCDGTV